MRQTIGLEFESRRVQKKFSVRDILSRFYHPGQKPPELLSRQSNPSSKTGTNGPLEPGQMARSVVVPGPQVARLNYYKLTHEHQLASEVSPFLCLVNI